MNPGNLTLPLRILSSLVNQETPTGLRFFRHVGYGAKRASWRPHHIYPFGPTPGPTPELGAPVDLHSLILLAVVMALVELLAGVGIGWWLRGSGEVAKQPELE